MRHLLLIIALLLSAVSCQEIDPQYPDEPRVDYQGFGLYITTDALNNKILVGRLSFNFTDGDGNIGLNPYADTTGKNLPDTVKYNFFLHQYFLDGDDFVRVPDSKVGTLKYRIPYLDKQPLSGTLDLEISYPVINYDTIYYTFYIFDRDYNRSNTDTTEVIVLSGINLDAL